MKPSPTVVGLALVVAALALVAATAGLFSSGGASPDEVVTVRGERVELYGEGVYRYDSLFKGAGNRGTDSVTLLVSVPLLLASTLLYARGSLRGGLLLIGAIGWFLYVYASMALGAAAYNGLFLVYVVIFSASLWAFLLAFSSLDFASLRARLGPLPWRAVGAFLIASGVLTLGVWLTPLLGSLLAGEAPKLLDTSTTMVTEALDLAVITPATLAAGVLVLRRSALGYVLALTLIVVLVNLGPAIAAQTISQESAGVEFTTAEIVGPITGFLILFVISIVLLVLLVRALEPVKSGHAPIDAVQGS